MKTFKELRAGLVEDGAPAAAGSGAAPTNSISGLASEINKDGTAASPPVYRNKKFKYKKENETGNVAQNMLRKMIGSVNVGSN
jgi:hypothetical protein